MILSPTVIFVFITLFSCARAALNENATKVVVPNRELILTEKEKNAFDQFKNAVHESIPKNLTLLRQDLYLLRFIRAKRLDVDFAKRELAAFMKFIFDNDAFGVLNEDWSYFEEQNKLVIGEDRKGRPVAYTSLEDDAWNFRKYILQGAIKKLVRYIYNLVWEVNFKLLDAQKKDPNVNQITIILNFNGFSIAEHGCPACLATFLNLLQLYEKWIPNYANEIILINAPQSLYLILNTVRPVLSPNTKSVLKIFGTNKAQWRNYLEDRIDPSQLAKFFEN